MNNRIRVIALIILWIVTGYFTLGTLAACMVAPSASPAPQSEFVIVMLIGLSLVAALTALHRRWHRILPVIPLLMILYSFAVIYHFDKLFYSQ